MNKHIKRLVALALTLCMFLSAVPPVATAEDAGSPAQTTIVYDFTSVESLNGTSLGSASTAAGKEMYQNGQVNWYYNGHQNGKSIMMGGTSADGSVDRSWEGIRYSVGNGGGFISLKIKVDAAATYQLKVNYQTCKDYGAPDVFILPGNTENIAAALETAQSYGSFDCYSNTYTYVDASAQLSREAELLAGDYYLVFRTANETTANVFACVTGFEMKEKAAAPQQTQPQNFDFTTDASLNGTSLGNAAIAAGKERFDNGEADWYYYGQQSTKSVMMGGTSADGSVDRSWDGIRYSVGNGGGWIAVKIRVNASDTYRVKVNYQTCKDYGAPNVYILSGSTDNIAAALETAQSYGSFNCYSTSYTYVNGVATLAREAQLEAGEYILVFRTANETASNIFACVTGALLAPAQEIPDETTGPVETTVGDTTAPEVTTVPEETTAPEEPPLQLDKATYDFTCVESLKATAIGTSVIKTTNNLYDNGELNWAIAQKSSSLRSATFGGGQYGWSGIRYAANPGGGWIAMKLQSPGSGNYKATVDYQTYKDYGVVKTYILPADTEDIDAALEDATSIGSFDCYSAKSTYTDATQTLGRAWPFVAGEEYLAVFYMTNSGTSAIYACVDGITLDIYTGSDLGGDEEEEEKPVAPGQRNEVEYDFDLGHNSQFDVKGESFGGKNPTFSVVGSAIGDYYANYKLDWKFGTYADGVGGYPMFGGTAGDKAYLWDGIRVYAKDKDSGDRLSSYYTAFTIRSPGTGNYYLTVNYQQHRYGAGKGSVYLLPADTQDISAAIASQKALLTVSYDNRSADSNAAAESAVKATLDPIALELDKEYILVFTADENGKAGYAYQYLSGIKLSTSVPDVEPEKGPAQLDQLVYDLQLDKTDLTVKAGVGFATKGLSGSSVRSAIDSYYYKGVMNWYYYGALDNTKPNPVFGGKVGAKNYNWTGLRVYAKDSTNTTNVYNYAIGFVLASPGSGDYKLTVDFGVHRYGAKNANVYIIPADTQDAQAALKNAQKLGSLNFDNGSGKSALAPDPGRTTFNKAVKLEAGKEYIVVFQVDAVGRNAAYMFLNKLTLTKSGVKTPSDIIPYRVPEPEPIPENAIVYDFDLSDPINGIQKGKKFILPMVDQLNTMYKNGTINWNYHSHEVNEDSAMCFTDNGGMILYAYEENWFAVKIKTPGKGLYTAYLNHGISGNGAVGAVYVLPGDTEDAYAGMDHSNRIGKLNYYNDTGVTTVTDGQRSMLGTWEFGDEEEYIIVFEAFDNTPYNVTRAYMFISQLFFVPGDHTAGVEKEKKINSIVVEPGSVKICDPTLYGTVTQVAGSNYLYMPLEGKKMLIYNLDDGVLIGETKTSFTVSRGICTDEDGIIWMVGDRPVVYRYDPLTGVSSESETYKPLDPESYTSFDLLEDGKGNLYFGSHPGGKVMKYDTKTDEYTVLCRPHEDVVYVCGMEYKDGFIYAGIYGDKNGDGSFTCQAVKINAETGEVVARLDLIDLIPYGFVMFRGAGLCGDTFFLGGEGNLTETIAIDINTFERIDIGMDRGIMMYTTSELDGKVYFVSSGGGLYCFDSATRKAEKVPGLEDVTVGLRCNDSSFITLEDPLYPGVSIITYSSSAIPRAYNLQTGKLKTWEVVDVNQFGTPTTARLVVDNGNGQFYTGAYNTNKCTIYDIAQGKVTGFFETEGQTDSMLMYEGVLYAGNYSAGALTRVNVEDPDRNVILLSLKNEWEQSRIHTITAGDGKVFVGSIPDRYEYGGCIAWVDVNTLERYVERNVVQDQAIINLVYHDGYLYGATSVRGGTGAADREDLSAKLFVYDVENKKKVAEVDLHDYINGLPKQIKMVAGIAADPNIDENGRLWGLVSETLFSWSFDKDTGKVTVKEELSFDKSTCNTSSNRDSMPRPFVFDDVGYMYLAFDNNGGLRKINPNNPKDNKRILQVAPTDYNIDKDNNLYYIEGQAMLLYPMDVTDVDWEIAGKVDAQIRALNKAVTLDTEAEIVAARTAYEALNWRHKALVQDLEVLQNAEVDLLECKIDTIGEATLDKKDMVFDLKAQYDAMDARMQRYVKNYSVLEEAHNVIQAILDKEAADAVQKMIDSIKNMGEITLEKEQDIRNIRAAYDALTVKQRALVDAKLLLEAEAKIKALRQVRIERLIQIIAQLGDPITLADEPAIVEAMEIYNWMYMDEREQVDYGKLIAAEAALKKLQKAAAAQVDALIENGEYKAARKAYDALTEGSKQYVRYYDYLLEVEAQGRLITIIVIAVVVVAGGVTAFILVKRKKQRSKTETNSESEESAPVEE